LKNVKNQFIVSESFLFIRGFAVIENKTTKEWCENKKKQTTIRQLFNFFLSSITTKPLIWFCSFYCFGSKRFNNAS
ncbi:hypothetical protein JIY74_38395, partial [Vibrio harveyi]|nr:hypothetical protein [Vibrio harveyi]